MANFITKSLRTKLLFWFLLVALVPLMVSGWLTFQSSKKSLVREIADRYVEDTRRYMEQIDMVLAERYGDIQILAGNPILTNKASTPEEITQELKRWKEAYGVYSSLSFFDPNRIRIADTAGLHIGQKHEMVKYWEDVLEGKISAGSDVRIAEELKIPIIYFASPVKDSAGNPFGAVVARYNPQALRDMLQHEEAGKEIYITVINKEGLPIFSNDPGYKDKILLEKVAQTDAVKAALKGEKGLTEEFHPKEGDRHLVTYFPEAGWGGFKGNNWSILISVGKYLAPVQALAKVFSLLGLVVLGIVVLVAFYVSVGIANPVKEISTIAAKVAEGDLTQRIRIRTQDEVGRLAGAFNQMIVSLKKIVSTTIGTAERVSSSSQQLSSTAQAMNATTEEVASTVQQIAKGMETQAQRVEETSKVMEKMNASVKLVAQSANTAASAQELAEMAIELRELVGKFKTGEEGRWTTDDGRGTKKTEKVKPAIAQRPDLAVKLEATKKKLQEVRKEPEEKKKP